MKTTAPRLNAPMVEWALWWASRGWPVFPVWQPISGLECGCGQTHKDSGKHPVISDGFKGGSADPEQIRAWWTQYPNANIGSTPPGGMVAIDIDGPLDDGVEFPETETHGTGKGKHLIYVNNMAKPLDQTQGGGRYWTNVDTRISGKGYIVLPPSLHMSGSRYELTNDMQPVEFPDEMVPDLKAKKTVAKKVDPADTEVVRLLTLPRDSDVLGDDAMAKVAGYLARYVPDKDHFDALLWAINAGLQEPLHPTALAKKRGIFDKHQQTLTDKEKQTAADEARGWLYELGGTGYHTETGTGDKIELVEFSDFRIVAKGQVVKADNLVFIVDFHRADGSVLESVHVEASTIANPSKMRDFCARRGMALYTNRGDKRPELGVRLMKMLQSQEPPVLESTEFYGWNETSQTFITDEGEITSEGERQTYSKVFPERNLTGNKGVHYGFDFDEAAVKDLLVRTLVLNEKLEMAKLGAWVIMMLLKGQWSDARMPGVITSAYSGTGKSSIYEIITAWLGYRQKGGKITAAVFRDMLSRSSNSAVWLDDFELSDDHKATMRAALTVGSESKMVPVNGVGHVDKTFMLRGSVIVTDEGNGLLAEKANADRFLKIDLTTGHRSTDVERLKSLDMSNGAGTLVSMALKRKHLLDELPGMLEQANDRASRWRCLLVVGARILSDILEDDSWRELVEDWVEEQSSGLNSQASILVHKIIPTVWLKLGNPYAASAASYPVFYDAASKTFWVNVGKLAEHWLLQHGLTKREQQLGSPEAIKKELEACGAHGKGKGKGPLKLRYQQLPETYSAMAYDLCNIDDDGAGDNDHA